MKKMLFVLSLLVLGCAGCSVVNNEITQYIVAKEGEQLRPVAKIIYKVFVDRQEVVYWVEVPGQERSQLYKMKNCIVVNAKNWEGDPDPYCFSLAWLSRVECVNGNFQGANVNWWTWHFNTEPKPSNLAGIVGGAIIMLIGLILLIRSGIVEKLRR